MEGLRIARERAGLTLKELGAKLAVEPLSVWRWEKGLRSPNLKTVRRLAEVLDCTTDDLLNPPQTSGERSTSEPVESATK